MTSDDHSAFRLIGISQAIRTLEDEIDTAARSDAKVLVTGETGVGKEIVANLIHQRSMRRRQPLVTLNCAGVPESLLESELFGHAKGSFTGAYRDRRGILEMGANGTVFLDEIGEMGLRMQAVLLRFLQSGEIQRVGADRPHTRVNVRLIAATNRDLRAQVDAGAFREDFYFRLNVISIVIPPLRERAEDIPVLVQHFLDEFTSPQGLRVSLASETMEMLQRYRWPGNVRELRNVIERLVVNAKRNVVSPADLPPQLLAALKTSEPADTVAAVATARVQDPATRMFTNGESFWTVVAPKLANGALSREDLRKLIHVGLERTQGSYRNLVSLFNMPEDDHIRFLNFLREHDCHLPRHGLRTTRRTQRRAPAAPSASASAIEKA